VNGAEGRPLSVDEHARVCSSVAPVHAAGCSGELRIRVHPVMPLDQVARAHRAMAKGGVRGRYMLKP
jgi:hypothetical protein